MVILGLLVKSKITIKHTSKTRLKKLARYEVVEGLWGKLGKTGDLNPIRKAVPVL